MTESPLPILENLGNTRAQEYQNFTVRETQKLQLLVENAAPDQTSSILRVLSRVLHFLVV
jgi:hypothetical protein